MPASGDESIIWTRPESTGRGRAPSYSRVQIARAAIAVADSEGLDAVTMRRVAAEIGAGPMSLYRYVRNKDELQLLMADAVAGERPADPSWEGWRQALREMARDMRQSVLTHPWWPETLAVAPLVGPNVIDGTEVVLAKLDGLGLDIDEMMEVATIVRTFALGYAKSEANRMPWSGGRDSDDEMRAWQPYVRQLVVEGRHPHVARIMLDARTPHERDRDAVFERALERVIAGIEATVPRSG